MSRVKDGNYVVIQSFMVKDLGLKGNELLIYAIIYGFSQNEQRFNGSLQYLADWTNCSKQTVQATLKSLCEKGFLEKFVYENNQVRFCEYQANFLGGMQKTCIPVQETCMGGMQNSCTNNISGYTNINNIVNNPDKSTPDLSVYSWDDSKESFQQYLARIGKPNAERNGIKIQEV